MAIQATHADIDDMENLWFSSTRAIRAEQVLRGGKPCFLTDRRYHCTRADCEWRSQCKRLVAEWRRH